MLIRLNSQFEKHFVRDKIISCSELFFSLLCVLKTMSSRFTLFISVRSKMKSKWKQIKWKINYILKVLRKYQFRNLISPHFISLLYPVYIWKRWWWWCCVYKKEQQHLIFHQVTTILSLQCISDIDWNSCRFGPIENVLFIFFLPSSIKTPQFFNTLSPDNVI